MKTLAILLVFLTGLALPAAAGTLVVDGNYQNKNLYIQNSYADNGVGFCVFEVTVNGQATHDEVNSSAFEIDLASYSFKTGDKVEISIKHKDGCIPKVLNPDALRPHATFTCSSITITPAGLLTWQTKNESGVLPYLVEQFRWNKWVYIGEVTGEGTAGDHTYNYQVTMHSGENRFRVRQVGTNKEVKLSPEIKMTSTVSVVSFTQADNTKSLLFSGETMFEVYDEYGNLVLKGFGKSADMTPFKSGDYYLCYDNKIGTIHRK